MFRTLRESFKITNNYLIIATPLILFSLFSSIYLILSSGGNTLSLTITAVLSYLMAGAFLSGWFYMIVKAVKNPNDEDKDRLIFEFPSGVGGYFLSILGFMLIVIFVSIGFIILTVVIGKELIGTVGISLNAFSDALYSFETMKAFLQSLNAEQMHKLKMWNLLLFFGMLTNYFVMMLYSAVLFFKEKNPIKAFLINIKDTFGRKFFKNLFLFIFICITYLVLSLVIALFGKNIFAHFILTLINFYYLTYIAILVFNYYYTNFAKKGSEIDTIV